MDCVKDECRDDVKEIIPFLKTTSYVHCKICTKSEFHYLFPMSFSIDPISLVYNLISEYTEACRLRSILTDSQLHRVQSGEKVNKNILKTT